jgi:DNA (cytosine-5)-methyltransferase 1
MGNEIAAIDATTRNRRADALRVLDMFAGAGGWDLALEALGYEVDGVEIMPEARATRDAAGLSTIHDDVWTLPSDLLWAYIAAVLSPPCQTFSAAGKGSGRKALTDVLRCVPHVKNWSRSRLRKVGKAFGDDRTALVLTPLWYALNMPNLEWTAWEQVPAVLPVWQACAVELERQGWHVWTGIVKAEQHGVAQTRKRAVLIASRARRVHAPAPTHSLYYSRDPKRLDLGVAKWVSMAECLGWAEDFVMVSNYGAGGDPSNRGEREGWQPAPTVTSKIDRNRIKASLQGGEPTHMGDVRSSNGCVRSVDEPAPTMTASMDNGNFRWVNAAGEQPAAMVAAGAPGEGRPRSVDDPAPTMTGKGTAYWLADQGDYIGPKPAIDGETPDDCEWVYDRPSPTIVGSFRPDVVAKPGYRKAGDPPRQKTPGSVRVTVQEAGALQSFPFWFPWQGGSGKQYLQAGNAVPPLMALAVVREAAGLGERLGGAERDLLDLIPDEEATA